MEAYEPIWPVVFNVTNFEYTGPNAHDEAMADGLTGWALCMSGNTPPQHFGYAMLKIGKVLGVMSLPDALMGLAIARKEQ